MTASAQTLSESTLKAYLESLLAMLKERAERFLPLDAVDSLIPQLALARTGIRAIVSTNFGVGWDYTADADGAISVDRSSSRIEHALFEAPASVRRTGPMIRIEGRDTSIEGLTLEGAFPIQLHGPDSSVRLRDVRFVVGRWRRIVELAELYGNRAPDRWTAERARSDAIDRVLLALWAIRQAPSDESLGETLHRLRDRLAIVLGDFSDTGRQRLATIIREVRAHGWEAVTLEDVPDFPDLDLQQKAVALCALAQFVVVDDSSRSGHLVELPLVQANRWVTVILREKGSAGTLMTRGVSATSKVIHEAEYDETTVAGVIADAMQWVSTTKAGLRNFYGGLYPHR
jgi:hypothetical protein